MEYVIIIGLVILFFVYLLAQDSKKETKKERYGEAIGNLASMAADSVADAAFKLTESADKKKIRLAEEALAERNGRIYRIRLWNSSYENDLKRYLEVDEIFKQQLELLGLTSERWTKLAYDIYYAGVIMQSSRNSHNYAEKINKWEREYLFSEKNKYNQERKEKLTQALIHFDIPIEEWVKYGETVLDMHGFYDAEDMKKYGYKTALVPMGNNFHLL